MRQHHENSIDAPARFDDLSAENQAALVGWIQAHIIPARAIWAGNAHGGGYVTSYGLKHTYQAHTGHYVTNGAFKGGMLACGHTPVDSGKQNWRYRIKPAYRGALRDAGNKAEVA